jgi:uroporphyrinogen-III synthase
VAAIGPVVREQLQQHGVCVDIMPAQAFFMKPLVTEILRYFNNPEKNQY